MVGCMPRILPESLIFRFDPETHTVEDYFLMVISPQAAAPSDHGEPLNDRYHGKLKHTDTLMTLET